MLRFVGFNVANNGRNLFFSNQSLLSMKLQSRLRLGAAKSRFILSNLAILEAGFGPRWRYYELKKTVINSVNQTKRSSTWKNYNRHYGRTRAQALKKPLLFTLAFCGITTFAMPYLYQYTPLKLYKKNPQALIYTIIALNGAVFLMWKLPQMVRYLTRYGLLVKDNVSNWAMVGSAFSHQSFSHILINMFVLQSFGSTLVSMIGVENFTSLYLNSAVISSFFSILIPVLARSSLLTASLGASGAIFSVVGAFSYLLPKAPLAFFFIPVPGGAWFLFLGTIAYNAAGIVFRWGVHDYAAHLGGSAAGIAYGWYYNKKRREAVRRRRIAF